jgi:solute:Na+ symporter, SSS family
MASGSSALLAAGLAVYVVVLAGIGLWARGRIRNTEDYLVAGRRLSFPLATATLVATWFGAGTLLVATDEVRSQGVRAAALDPGGAGLCLILAGLFFAVPLWRMRLLTVSDFFRRRFGPRAEVLSAVLLVPGYFGWIAAQFVALAGLLQLCFGIDPSLGIALVAAVGMGYTLIGGMWSVAATDFLQLGFIVVGLVALAAAALRELGGAEVGLARLLHETPPEILAPLPTGDRTALLRWTALLAAGALGNLPGQDLLQRVFAARSAAVARRACLAAGVAYLALGAIPVGLGLAARILVPGGEKAILAVLADLLLHPALALIFVLAIASAVLSTVDSAILAPSSVLAQNLLVRVPGAESRGLALNHLAVFLVTGASLGVAYAGEDAWSLLESAYEIGLVSLLVPLVMGLWGPGGERAAVAAMLVGTGLWLAHRAAGWAWFGGPALAAAGATPPPVGLGCAGAALVVYLAAGGWRHGEPPDP